MKWREKKIPTRTLSILLFTPHPPIVPHSDSVNFWFYAPSSSRQALVATETSFPVSRALNCRASIADTFVEIERSGNVEDDAIDSSSPHQLSPELQAHF